MELQGVVDVVLRHLGLAVRDVQGAAVAGPRCCRRLQPHCVAVPARGSGMFALAAVGAR